MVRHLAAQKIFAAVAIQGINTTALKLWTQVSTSSTIGQ